MSLPTSKEGCRGLRAAMFLRESTAGQSRRTYYFKIRCQGCGLHLRGDTRRYCHPQPICVAWLAAQPRVTGPRRGRHTTSLGQSYAAEMYEGLVEVILLCIGEPDAALITQVVPRLWREASPEARQLIAASLFEETSALGWRFFSYRWTAHAIRRGLGEVIPWELHLTDDEMVLVGARGIAPRPPTFPSRCGSPRRQSPSTGCGAHDTTGPLRRRASDRP